MTAPDLAENVDITKRTVHRVLKRLIEHGAVQAIEGVGLNGATRYADDVTPNAGVVDLTDENGEVATPPGWDSYTWTVAIRDRVVEQPGPTASTTPTDGSPTVSTGGSILLLAGIDPLIRVLAPTVATRAARRRSR